MQEAPLLPNKALESASGRKATLTHAWKVLPCMKIPSMQASMGFSCENRLVPSTNSLSPVKKYNGIYMNDNWSNFVQISLAQLARHH